METGLGLTRGVETLLGAWRWRCVRDTAAGHAILSRVAHAGCRGPGAGLAGIPREGAFTMPRALLMLFGCSFGERMLGVAFGQELSRSFIDRRGS